MIREILYLNVINILLIGYTSAFFVRHLPLPASAALSLKSTPFYHLKSPSTLSVSIDTLQDTDILLYKNADSEGASSSDCEDSSELGVWLEGKLYPLEVEEDGDDVHLVPQEGSTGLISFDIVGVLNYELFELSARQIGGGQGLGNPHGEVRRGRKDGVKRQQCAAYIFNLQPFPAALRGCVHSRERGA